MGKVHTFRRAANDNRLDPMWSKIITEFGAISPIAREMAVRARLKGYTPKQFRDAILLRAGIDPSDPGGNSPFVSGREAMRRRWEAAKLLVEVA